MMNQTKVIATVGPGCDDKKTLQSLVELGVCCFRINLSHGTKDEKVRYFELIKTLKTTRGFRPTILADLAGPKIRIRKLDNNININRGESVRLSNEQEGPGIISLSKGVRFEKIIPGAKILIDDGRLTLEVKRLVSDHTIDCVAVMDGTIENRKGVNFPGVSLNTPVLTQQDKEDLQVSLSSGADWIALSFVRSASDYGVIRKIIKEAGYTTPVMGKIEKWEAVQDVQSIVDCFDAVMVARGDLGVEMPIEKVPLIQKEVIEKANQAGKPVVIATQILDSMIDRPVPTRAEVSDIANAILDGADSLMVTGETAVGKHPKKVIEVLSRVVQETESSLDYQKDSKKPTSNKLKTANAISHAACSVSRDQGIGVLVTMTHSGGTARMAARYRPSAKIIAMTPFRETCRRLSIVWGVNPILVDSYESADELPHVANRALKKHNLIKKGERFVMTGGVPVGVPGTTNYLSVLKAG